MNNRGVQMNNPPAFPRPAFGGKDTFQGNSGQEGMTLRDYFAAKAMQSHMLMAIRERHSFTLEGTAHDAYAYADAMLKARKL